MFIEVLVEIKAKGINQTFTYHVPNNLENDIAKGKRVLVPFGKQKIEGFVLGIKDKCDINTKDVIEVVDEDVILNDEMLELGSYMSKKTLTNLISCFQTMLPKALKAKHNYQSTIKYISYIKLIDNNYEPKNDNQKHIIELLKEEDRLKSDLTKISVSSINTLLSKGIIEEYKEEHYRLNNNFKKELENIKLSEEQLNVVNECKNNINIFTPYLLYGVTGSGKTEVYMQLIDEVIKQKKEALVLVPEISLTPVIVDKFQRRFGNKIAILHSGLSDGEKYDEWRKIMRGEVSIVIGARSAAFAPLTNLGIIIVDEEHSDSYKQENNPKYDTHDILLYRAKYHNCPIIFGSATPKIESYTRAKLGIYKLLTMKKRYATTMPKVEFVNMQDEIKKGRRIISKSLADELIETLNRNEQAIIFLNRRGYSTILTCQDCGYKELCPNCDIPLTYHKKYNVLNCHYCGYKTYKKDKCPDCGSTNMHEFGLGTEKLEEEIKKLTQKAKVVRMDQDTTTKKGSHSRIFEEFKNKKYNVLVGTQMIAKGLDFPDVTLVGVINADQTLNIPDFRSAEKTFAMLCQVSGRSGRSEKNGKVIMQGFNLDHYSILYTKNHDYEAFYDEEIKIRKKLDYPPFSDLIKIQVVSSSLDYANNISLKIANYLKNNHINVLGPTAAMIPKINNKYYIQLIIKTKNMKEVYEYIKFIREKDKADLKVNIDIDLSPIKL